MAKLTDMQLTMRPSVSVQKTLKDFAGNTGEQGGLLRHNKRDVAAARKTDDGVLPGTRGADRHAHGGSGANEGVSNDGGGT